MKSISLFTTCLALLLGFFANDRLSAKINAQPKNIYTQDDSAYAREKRDLTRRLQTLKSNVDAQLTQLRAESGNAKKEAQKDYQASIDNLQKMSKQLQSELDQTQN